LSARRSNADNLPLAVPYERMAVQTKILQEYIL